MEGNSPCTLQVALRGVESGLAGHGEVHPEAGNELKAAGDQENQCVGAVLVRTEESCDDEDREGQHRAGSQVADEENRTRPRRLLSYFYVRHRTSFNDWSRLVPAVS